MPRYNQQETPQDRRLAELAAITQLYGAMAGPQERQAQERQRSAMEMLGPMIQAHTAQQAEAFRQQQLAGEEKHWQTEADVQRQGHEDMNAQRREAAQMRSADEAERNRIHEEDIGLRNENSKFSASNQFLAAPYDQQKQMATADPDRYGEMFNRVKPMHQYQQYQSLLPAFQSLVKKHPEQAGGFAEQAHADPEVAQWLNSMLPPVGGPGLGFTTELPQQPSDFPSELANLAAAAQQNNAQNSAERGAYDQQQQQQQKQERAFQYLKQIGLFNNKPKLSDFVGAQ